MVWAEADPVRIVHPLSKHSLIWTSPRIEPQVLICHGNRSHESDCVNYLQTMNEVYEEHMDAMVSASTMDGPLHLAADGMW